MYIDLKKSVENLISANNDQKRLYYFALERYNEKYPNERYNAQYSWHHYETFQIIDVNTIRVLFKYGDNNIIHSGKFDLDMRPYYREEKINLLDI